MESEASSCAMPSNLIGTNLRYTKKFPQNKNAFHFLDEGAVRSTDRESKPILNIFNNKIINSK